MPTRWLVCLKVGVLPDAPLGSHMVSDDLRESRPPSLDEARGRNSEHYSLLETVNKSTDRWIIAVFKVERIR